MNAKLIFKSFKLTIIATTAILILALVTMASSYAASTEPKIESNVVYGMQGGLALLMDVYHPNEPNGVAIITIPGSGFHEPLSYDAPPLNQKNGYWFDTLGAELLLKNGYTLFVINHRSAPIFYFPANVDDAQRAVRFIRHNAKRFAINPEYMGAIGHSSGAYLASMLGVLSGNESLSGLTYSVSDTLVESPKVQAVVSLAGAYDLESFATGGAGALGAIASFVGTHIGAWRGENSVKAEFSLYQAASPSSYVTVDDSPFYVIHGDSDHVVPFAQNEIFYKKLMASGVPTKRMVIKSGGHMFSAKSDSLGLYNEIIAFFNKKLHGKE